MSTPKDFFSDCGRPPFLPVVSSLQPQLFPSRYAVGRDFFGWGKVIFHEGSYVVRFGDPLCSFLQVKKTVK